MKIFNPTVSGSIILPTGSAPVTSSGFAYIYAKTDGKIYLTQEDGTEAEVGGGGGGSTATEYTVTLNDAENTTSQITLLSFTVPANTITDGDVIALEYYSDASYSNFSNPNVIMSGSATGLTDWGITYTLTGALIRGNLYGMWFKRVGSDLLYLKHNAGSPNVINANITNGMVRADRISIQSSFDFTVDFTMQLKIAIPEANPNSFVRSRNAYAFKINTNSYFPFGV